MASSYLILREVPIDSILGCMFCMCNFVFNFMYFLNCVCLIDAGNVYINVLIFRSGILPVLVKCLEREDK